MADVDPDKLKMYSFALFSKLEGAITSGMVYLGDHLGLYAAMKESGGKLTSAELAIRTGLDERWVREWLHNQGASRLVEWEADGDGAAFWLSAEAEAVLATPGHPAFGIGMFARFPATIGMLDRLPESFRSGIGYDYDALGASGAAGIEQAFEPWYENSLLDVGLPALDGVVDRLQAGVDVADVGCGAGVAVCLMADAFPNSTFRGYDISEHALARARYRAARLGLANASFHDARTTPLPADHSVGLLTTFDCIHDMARPQQMIEALRQAISPDGSWLLVDIKARETYAENVQKNPMASLMYGISVMSCMSSALSEPGGAGLGTLGLPASVAERMTAAAGFTRFRKLDIDHPINAFYEVRP